MTAHTYMTKTLLMRIMKFGFINFNFYLHFTASSTTGN